MRDDLWSQWVLHPCSQLLEQFGVVEDQVHEEIPEEAEHAQDVGAVHADGQGHAAHDDGDVLVEDQVGLQVEF